MTVRRPALVTEAVERRLELTDYLDSQREVLLRGFEEAWRSHEDPLMFVADALPLATAAIIYGSHHEKRNAALRWARETQKEADASAYLSVLTFLYVVDIGLADSDSDLARHKVWEEIRKVADNMLAGRDLA